MNKLTPNTGWGTTIFLPTLFTGTSSNKTTKMKKRLTKLTTAVLLLKKNDMYIIRPQNWDHWCPETNQIILRHENCNLGRGLHAYQISLYQNICDLIGGHLPGPQWLRWVQHISFRHEVGVAYSPVEIIYADDQLIVVNKPASVPVSERQNHFNPLWLTHPTLPTDPPFLFPI